MFCFVLFLFCLFLFLFLIRLFCFVIFIIGFVLFRFCFVIFIIGFGFVSILFCYFYYWFWFCFCFVILLMLQVKDTADSRLQAGITASPETQKKLTGIMSKVAINKNTNITSCFLLLNQLFQENHFLNYIFINIDLKCNYNFVNYLTLEALFT